METTRTRRPYLPEELAYAVVSVRRGQSLSSVAAELRRDRSGLLRVLRAMGYPTAPERPDPARRRAEVAREVAALRSLSRDEIKQRILRLRHQAR